MVHSALCLKGAIHAAFFLCLLIFGKKTFAEADDPDAGVASFLDTAPPDTESPDTDSNDFKNEEELASDGFLSLEDLNEIPVEEDPAYSSVITGKRPFSPGTVVKLDKDEIALRGARNLPEALATEPGVEVSRSPKAGSTLQIRGFDEKSVLLLFEGIPIREVYDGHFNIASLPIFSFDSVELEKGVASLLYGPNSAGGILKMKAPNVCDKVADVNVFGKASGSAEAMFGGQAEACVKISDVTLFAGIGHEESNGYALSGDYEENEHNEQYHENGGTRDGSDYERSSISFLAKYAPAPGKNINLFVDAVRSPRSISPFEGYGYTRYWRFVTYDTLLVGLSGAYGPNNAPVSFGFRGIKTQLYTHVHRDELRDYEDATYSVLTTNSLAWFRASAYANETYGASIQGAWALNRGNTLDVSLRYNFDFHRQREIPVPDEGEEGEWTAWEKYMSHTFTAAIEDTQLLGPWRLNAGFSANGMSLLAQKIRDKSYSVDKRVIPGFEGRLTAEYSPIEGLWLTIAAGHKVRYPMLKELFSNAVGGNPNLGSERAWTAEAGLDTNGLLLNGLHTSVRFFGNSVRDLIDKYRDVYSNIGRSVIAGAELEIRYKPVELLQFHAGYRYLFTRDLESGKPLDYRTPHRVVLGERLFFKFGLTLSLEAIFSSGQEAYYVDSASGEWVEDKLSSFALLNAHLRYERTIGDFSKAYLYIDGFNLLDADYCIGSFEPRAGREIIIGIGSRI